MKKQSDLKDILIEDKGENISILPQTEKSIRHFKSLKLPQPFEVLKSESIKILTWAVSHGFTVDSKVLFIIKSIEK